MQTTAHAVQYPRARRGRARWLFLAILLQVGFVYALVNGLEITVGPIKITDPFDVTIPKSQKPPPAALPQGRMLEPELHKPIAPDIVIETGVERPPGITPPTGNGHVVGPADHGPVGLAATHTTPPYPPIEARLGHEGTVVLRLTIAPDGRVIDAVVVKTSGYERLDMAARDWVTARWRYRPAVRGGAAVAGTATVGVRFNLTNAG